MEKNFKSILCLYVENGVTKRKIITLADWIPIPDDAIPIPDDEDVPVFEDNGDPDNADRRYYVHDGWCQWYTIHWPIGGK
jgi:hypothetical protein